jgi:hypothetical protein
MFRLMLMVAILAVSNSVYEPCRLPKGPIFTALSYWEAFSGGALNVADLFLLSEILNGTVVEPYVNDLNSQHPYSGLKAVSANDSSSPRTFSQVFDMDKFLQLLHVKTRPVAAHSIVKCQVGGYFVYLKCILDFPNACLFLLDRVRAQEKSTSCT